MTGAPPPDTPPTAEPEARGSFQPQLSDRTFARRIDITSLQLFAAACELGSIGKAAEQEALAVSAASKRLSELEATVGARLFHRHMRGVDITPAGQTMLHHTRSILFRLQRMRTELAEYGQGVRGHIRIYANMSAIVQYLPEDLGDFSRDHPHVKIDITEKLSIQIPRAVFEGAADLGICSENALEAFPGLQTVPYRSEELALIVPLSHPLASQPQLQFCDTLAFDYVGMQEHSSISLAIQEAARAANAELRLRIQVTTLDAMARMIVNGLGIGIMPRRAYQLLGATDLVSITLNDSWARRQLFLASKDFDLLPSTAKLLVAHLHQKTP